MKNALAASFIVASLLDSTFAAAVVTEAKDLAPNEAFRSDSTLRFMRRRVKQNPIDALGKAAEEADKKGAPKVNNPIDAIGKAAERADEHVADHIADTHESVSDTVESVDKARAEQAADTKEKADKAAADAQQSASDTQERADKARAKQVADAQKRADKAQERADKAAADTQQSVADTHDSVSDSIESAPERADKAASDALEADPTFYPLGKPKHVREAEQAAKQADEDEDEEAEDKEESSVQGCRNSPKGWTDKKGQDCEDYKEGEWCNRFGGYGDGWLDDWPKFEELARHGKAATQVCCVCGGGARQGEDSGMTGGAPSPSAYAAAAPGPAITRPAKGLQEQGFMGELVEHEDDSTMTEDWGKEFGPASGHRDIKKICRDHKDNEWCLMHGYYDSDKKSSSTPQSMCAVIAVALLMWLR